MLAPIALFVFARPEHTRRTVDSLKQNYLAHQSELFIFSDAEKSEAQEELVCEVRQYIRQIEGFKSVTIVERETNFGLANSIIEGVTSIVNKQGRVIVLEDDLITSPYFLTYMNDALEKYSNDDRVASIHGYLLPCNKSLPDAFFLPGADCWGWATWRRGWEHFNPSGQSLLDNLKRGKLTHTFDYNGTAPFLKILEDQIEGRNNSWAIRWHTSVFLAGKLTLYPGRSLVHNIGHDSSGNHCGETSKYDTVISEAPIDISNVVVEPSQQALLAFEEFYRREQTAYKRLIRSIFSLNLMKTLTATAKEWLPTAAFRLLRKMLIGS